MSFAVVVLVASVAAPAMAQDDEGNVSSTEAQEELNQRGVEAIIDGDFSAAIRLFKSSLDIGPLNITYLNLGRAYQKANQCEDALAAYNDVENAPQVTNPSPSQIAAALEKYRAELASTCLGFVVMECSARMNVSIDGGDPVPCTAEKIPLPPGDHRFEGIKGDRRVQAGVTVVGMKTSTVVLDLGPEPTSTMKTWAYVTGVTGIALLGTGLAIDVFVLGPKIDELREESDGGDRQRFDELKEELQTLQFLNIGLYVAGGLLVATGVTLFILAPPGEETADSTTEGALRPYVPSPWVTPDSAGLQWQLRF